MTTSRPRRRRANWAAAAAASRKVPPSAAMGIPTRGNNVTYARRAVFIPDPDAINVLRTLAATITRARASTAGACRARGGSLSARARGPPEAENAICREAAEKLFFGRARATHIFAHFLLAWTRARAPGLHCRTRSEAPAPAPYLEVTASSRAYRSYKALRIICCRRLAGPSPLSAALLPATAAGGRRRPLWCKRLLAPRLAPRWGRSGRSRWSAWTMSLVCTRA